MGKAVILALAAGIFTAVSSISQRRSASRVPGMEGFSVRLLGHLMVQPAWLLGVASMVLGFVCQATALHFGSLALVQPILGSELLFVFGYIALVSPHGLHFRDWLAAGAMAVGLGVFLLAAAPSGGRAHAPASLWVLGALASIGAILALVAAAYLPRRRGGRASPTRRAALLGIATGISWGFLAAVIKEVGSHVSQGLGGIFSSWSLYVLVGAGVGSMILASNALHAGPLPASQPGFTIVDPLVASLLGVFIFRDHLQLGPLQLAVEAVALATLVFGVLSLSRCGLIHGENAPSGQSSATSPSRRARAGEGPGEASAGGAELYWR